MTPVWLMDVDSVLNIYGWGADRVARAWGDTHRINVLGFPITLSRAMLGRIKEMHARGQVEVRWLTTWEDHANDDLAQHLGWRQLVVAGRRAESNLERPRKFSESHDAYREDVGWWKLEFAQAVYDTGVPVIWTDDEIGQVRHALDWVNKVKDDGRLLAIAPVAGLMPSDLDTIEEFTGRWNAS